MKIFSVFILLLICFYALLQLHISSYSWEDQTVAGIWKQSQGTSLTAQFTKISLSKVVLFSDAKAKTDYFDQQSKFVNRWSKVDELAEFSTNIEGMLQSCLDAH